MKTQPFQFHTVPGRRGLSLMALSFCLLCWGGTTTARAATASPPEFMTYQGFLVDATGAPLANNTPANYPVNFRVYNASSGGTLIWSELQVVTVDRGQFSVLLGEGTAIANEPAGVRPTLSQVFTNNTASELYMEIQVSINGTPNTILPRLRLVTSPYAHLSSSANKLVAPNSGATFVSYNSGTSRTEISGNLNVAGNLNATGTISGNGSGITGLNSGQIPNLNASTLTSGTLNDARLSGNVARRDAGNAFTSGNQTITGGNLGVGTASPNYLLSLGNGFNNTKLALSEGGGSPTYGLGAQSSQFRFHVGSSSDRFSFLNGPAGTEIMTLKGDGRLGINTTQPSERLHVNGNVRVDGSLTANSLSLNSGPIVAGAESGLRIIRGTVGANGNRIAGGGFSVSRTAIGKYVISFSTQFNSNPSTTATVHLQGVHANITTTSRDKVEIGIWTAANLNLDVGFDFICIGPQ